MDLWALTLGLRNIDEPEESTLLPKATMRSLEDTFLSYGPQDRLTLSLAIPRLVQPYSRTWVNRWHMQCEQNDRVMPLVKRWKWRWNTKMTKTTT